MRPQTRTVSSQAASDPIVVNWRAAPFSIGFGVVLSGSATLTYDVEHTFDDPEGGDFANATWFDHESVAAATADADGNYAFPVRAVRLNVTAYTSGSATLTLLQGDFS